MLNFIHSLRYTVCIQPVQQSLVRHTGTLNGGDASDDYYSLWTGEKYILYGVFVPTVLPQYETISTNLGWGIFAKLQKVTNSFVAYVRMSQLGSYKTEFYEVLYSSVRRSVKRWVLDAYLYFTALPWNFSDTALKIACKKFMNVTRIFTTTFTAPSDISCRPSTCKVWSKL